MPILCFEGPSAVGKTTTAAVLAERGAVVIPEVNILFERPARESRTWYLEQQARRWALAMEAAAHHPMVILDGDPFQPLWYNWAYGFVGWQSLDELEGFYRPRLVQGAMRVPDLTVVFGASEAVLRARKDADPARQRRGFERHLQLVEPQRRYFAAMQAVAPSQVRFLDAQSIVESADAIEAMAERTRPSERSVEVFDHLVTWLRRSLAP
jgi:thymidylate kinase